MNIREKKERIQGERNKCHVKASNTFYINTRISGHKLIFLSPLYFSLRESNF